MRHSRYKHHYRLNLVVLVFYVFKIFHCLFLKLNPFRKPLTFYIIQVKSLLTLRMMLYWNGILSTATLLRRNNIKTEINTENLNFTLPLDIARFDSEFVKHFDWVAKYAKNILVLVVQPCMKT
jgi:hypothetical protein